MQTVRRMACRTDTLIQMLIRRIWLVYVVVVPSPFVCPRFGREYRLLVCAVVCVSTGFLVHRICSVLWIVWDRSA